MDALSPLDGRYNECVAEIRDIFSERALIRYRLQVECKYLIFLRAKIELVDAASVAIQLNDICQDDTITDRVKSIEESTNHDVKAVELALAERLVQLGHHTLVPFIHFGLTSQDINSVALWLQLRAARTVLCGHIKSIATTLHTNYFDPHSDVPMLARTHGQPATPTTMGKEMMVFVERLARQYEQLQSVACATKFGGATGGLNAHHLAYPHIDWPKAMDTFLADAFQFQRQQFTTQIDHYDGVAQLFDAIKRCNVVLIDMCRDMWQYISMGYFKQHPSSTSSIGSSTMPHKVNPIHFENAEGNLSVANALLEFMSSKLPVSRLQRDLTDSTVLRNVGVAFGHTLLAYKKITQALATITLDTNTIDADLLAHPQIVTEGIQTLLRANGNPNAYNEVKHAIARDESTISMCTRLGLPIITPFAYTTTLSTHASDIMKTFGSATANK